MKILIIEDDALIAEVLQTLFSSSHYAVDITATGEAGLEMAEAFDYELVLLDIGLPGLDGVSVCRQFRDRGFKMPILLLTALNDIQQKATALNAGADDYVVKPFDAEELMARVRALLRRGEMQTQPTVSFTHLFIKPVFRFIRHYVLKRGFLDGKVGLVIAMLSTYSVFIKYLKLWRQQQGETIASQSNSN